MPRVNNRNAQEAQNDDGDAQRRRHTRAATTATGTAVAAYGQHFQTERQIARRLKPRLPCFSRQRETMRASADGTAR